MIRLADLAHPDAWEWWKRAPQTREKNGKSPDLAPQKPVEKPEIRPEQLSLF